MRKVKYLQLQITKLQDEMKELMGTRETEKHIREIRKFELGNKLKLIDHSIGQLDDKFALLYAGSEYLLKDTTLADRCEIWASKEDEHIHIKGVSKAGTFFSVVTLRAHYGQEYKWCTKDERICLRGPGIEREYVVNASGIHIVELGGYRNFVGTKLNTVETRDE